MMTFWERACNAGGSFEADRVFLIVEGACALEDCIGGLVQPMHVSWFLSVPCHEMVCLSCIGNCSVCSTADAPNVSYDQRRLKEGALAVNVLSCSLQKQNIDALTLQFTAG
eukprot:scaffold315747_cov21-Tisochrysis_lutea.AAC.1